MLERELNVEPEDFRLWVCLHEQTHRVQFAAAPWLRGHLLELITGCRRASAEEAASWSSAWGRPPGGRCPPAASRTGRTPRTGSGPCPATG
ncbi:hypothetical protein A5N15_02895 [Rothia kristinae]|uniref:Uncharacterized protein n=1 Tax=Rothia kristinae TaxID=37923 RepID=A0A657IXA6_9MICC|nr:hypothetical protein A5N15_02895 [Rothia kristinae]